MTLLNRYLEAVRKQLPRAQRDDIAAELRDALLSQIEAEQADRGRPLTDDDVSPILKRYGSPSDVAARYGARRHLIGPQVFPHYLFAVKLVVWIVIPLMLGAAALEASGSERPIAVLLRGLAMAAVVALANLTIVTLLFARYERLTAAAPPAEWDPRELGETPRRRTSIPRAAALASLVITAFWLAWWLDVLPINYWLLWRWVPLQPAAVPEAFVGAIAGLMLASMAIDAIALLRPTAVRFYEAGGVVLEVAVLFGIGAALQVRPFVVAAGASGEGLAAVLNGAIFLGLIAWALVVVASLAWTLRRWIRINRAARQLLVTPPL